MRRRVFWFRHMDWRYLFHGCWSWLDVRIVNSNDQFLRLLSFHGLLKLHFLHPLLLFLGDELIFSIPLSGCIRISRLSRFGVQSAPLFRIYIPNYSHPTLKHLFFSTLSLDLPFCFNVALTTRAQCFTGLIISILFLFTLNFILFLLKLTLDIFPTATLCFRQLFTLLTLLETLFL